MYCETMLASVMTLPSPSVIAGKTRCRHEPVPEIGSHPNWTPRIRASNGPSQKFGIDTPANDAIRAGRGTAPEYDGITEVWFDAADSLLSPATADAAAAARTLIEDEGRMLDLAACSVFVTVEHEIF